MELQGMSKGMSQGCALWWTVTSWCTEACLHHHARHDIQTKVRSPFSDVARRCEAQAAAVSHGVSTTSNCRGRVDAVIRLWVVVVNRFE
jgi:hypothetical protein